MPIKCVIISICLSSFKQIIIIAEQEGISVECQPPTYYSPCFMVNKFEHAGRGGVVSGAGALLGGVYAATVWAQNREP